MKIVTVTPGMTSIPLGRQGENLRTKIVFPVQEWLEEYPEASIGLINRRPDEREEYPVLISGIEDGTVKWTVGAAELANDGDGECTLIAMEGEVVVKSKNYKTVVFRSLAGEGDAPDPWASWIEYFEELKDDAEDAAEDAETAAENCNKVVIISDTQPENEPYNKLWIKDEADEEYQIPTWEEHQALAARVEVLEPEAEAGDVGKFLKAKTVEDGKVTEYELAAGGGGGGGTSDYNDLTNKPQINSVSLSGNKSLSDLGIASSAAVAEKYTKPQTGIPATDLASGVIPDVSGFYTKPQNGIPASDLASGVIPDVSGFYTKPAGGIPASDIASGVIPDVSGKMDEPSSDGTDGQVLATDGDGGRYWKTVSGGGGGTSDYSDLTNKPQINSVTLSGNKSLSDLGIASATDLSAKYEKPSGGIPATDIASGVIPVVTGFASKVTSPTENNFAALTSGGDLKDSGKKASDFLTSHQDITGKADKVTSATSGNFAALDSNGNLTDSGHKHSDYLTSHQSISGKADKVASATSGNFAALDSNGNLKDSGHKHSDYLTSHQDISGKVNGAPSSVNNDVVIFDGTTGKTIKDSGYTIGKSVPSDAVFTDTTYESKTAASGGTAVSLVTTGEKYTWNNKGTYSKPSGGIPGTDLADNYIEEPSSDGTNGQVLTTNGSGGRSWTTVQIPDPIVTDIPFSFDNKYINDSGVETSATGYEATDYFDVTGADAIAFSGVMGSSYTVFWYDSSKTFISANLKPQEKMIWYYNILMLKPSTAKYVRLVSKKTTASNPPPIEPVATAYTGKNYMDYLMKNIVGDGETDDTTAVRKIVNMANSVTFPANKNILLSGSVSVALGYASVIDGNGTTLIMDGDYFALTVEGTLNSSAAPSTIDDYVLKSEGGAVIKNFKITNAEPDEGGGIDVAKAFNLKLEDNYIYKCDCGIRFTGMNRDIIISENHIFAINTNGILFDSSANVHQCNIVNNIILFALNDIHIYNPSAIANFQIVGNDIEIVNYPSTGYNVAKCICFETSTQPGMFSEIEISGNTIQGHGTSAYIMYFLGHTDENISDMNITGNHISNSNDCAVYLKNCCNVALTGNTYAEILHYVYEMDGNCENIMIIGEIGRAINENTVASGGKIHAASTATLTNIRCKNTLFTSSDTNNIETSNVTNVVIEDESNANGVSF